MLNKMALSSFPRLKDEGVIAFLCRDAVKNLKKKGIEDNFEFLNAVDKGKFRRMLAPSIPIFYGE